MLEETLWGWCAEGCENGDLVYGRVALAPKTGWMVDLGRFVVDKLARSLPSPHMDTPNGQQESSLLLPWRAAYDQGVWR